MIRHLALTTSDDISGVGGVENSIMRIARGLSSVGVEVDIIMLHSCEKTEFQPYGNNGITILESSHHGISIFKLTPWTGKGGDDKRWVEMHYALLELARKRRYDLMQAFYATTSFPTVYAAKILDIPSIVSIRGSDLITDVFQPQSFPYLTWTLQHATQFTAVSQEGLERARIICGCHEKGQVILNSICPEDFDTGVEILEVSHPVIGSLAVFRYEKGLEILLTAFHTLLQQFPTAHLLLVGPVIISEKGHLDDLVEKYDLTGKVTLIGHIPRSKVLRYLRTMDVFVFSSLQDGSPNAILEAMLAGLPIVAARSGALPEMLEDGKEGFLVRAGSADELSKAVTKLLDMPGDQRRTFGEMAKKRVLRQFVPERELMEYMDVYEKCLSQGAF